MAKTRQGPNNFLFPMPVVLVGANVKGKANFLAIAYVGIVNHTPPMISVALRKNRFTSGGIKENKCFSVNAASAAMVEATDYCGIYSGAKVDKSQVFEVFYGQLASAPMIEESPFNLECKLAKILDFGGSHELFVGEIVEAYSSDDYFSDGRPDVGKIEPIVFDGASASYWTLRDKLARAFQIGKDYQP